MITINLISSRRNEQNRYRRIGEIMIRCSMFIAVGTLAFAMTGVLSLRRTQEAINQTNLAKVAYQDEANEVRRLRATNGELTPRVDLVNSSRRRLDHWQFLYAQVARSLPEDVRVESINVAPGSSGGDKTLQVVGRGDNAYAISKMLLALNTQPGFSDVVMEQVNLAVPHEATMSAKLAIKPLPEDAPAAAPATPPGPK